MKRYGRAVHDNNVLPRRSSLWCARKSSWLVALSESLVLVFEQVLSLRACIDSDYEDSIMITMTSEIDSMLELWRHHGTMFGHSLMLMIGDIIAIHYDTPSAEVH